MKIVIIDDDRLVVSSLKTILESDDEIEVVASGNSGHEAIKLYNDYLPDVLLMDIRMENMTGLEAAEKILQMHSNAKILFLTTFSDDEYIIKTFRMGAKGYILKQNFASINSAVKTVHMGQRVFGDEIITKIPALMNNAKTNIDKYNLTEKEIEIISHVAEGKSNKEIAEALFFSEGTIRNYISIILEKLNLRDRTQLAIFWYKVITGITPEKYP